MKAEEFSITGGDLLWIHREQKLSADAHTLRMSCPCLECKSGSGVTGISSGIQVLQAVPAGRYGLKLLFSDGHEDGIYTFTHLRNILRPQKTDSGP